MSAPSFAVQTPAAKAVLGKSVVFKGQIESREDLIIEGEVEGTIEMMEHRLTIAPTGEVKAAVFARELEVLGSIEGKVEAVDKVYIRKGARFIGDAANGASFGMAIATAVALLCYVIILFVPRLTAGAGR